MEVNLCVHEVEESINRMENSKDWKAERKACWLISNLSALCEGIWTETWPKAHNVDFLYNFQSLVVLFGVGPHLLHYEACILKQTFPICM